MMVELKPPEAVGLGITGRCNLSCSYCISYETLNSDFELSYEQLKGIIVELKKLKVKSVYLHGGEVLTRRDIFEIIGLIHDNGINLNYLTTNGTLLSREKAKRLKTAGIDELYISFDAVSPEIMDNIRGKGAFKEALAGVKYSVDAGIKVNFNVPISKANHKNIREIIDLAKDLQVREVRLNHLFFHSKIPCSARELALSPLEEREAINNVNALNKEFNNFLTGDYVAKIEWIKNAEDNLIIPQEYVFVESCDAANKQMAIRPDGWVVPCCNLWNVKAGNINKENLIEIWENSEILNMFRKSFFFSFEGMNDCRNCIYQNICFRGHLCTPYYLPNGVKDKNLYCFVPGGTKTPVFNFE